MTQTTCPGPDPNPRAPGLRLPPGSCDAHCHVFGPGHVFPYAPGRTFTPPDAPKEDLRRLHDLLGLQRAVIVQSACHGTDHAALLDALAAGAGRYRGVALVTPSTSDDQVRVLHEAGVRGARLNFTPHLGPPPTDEAIEAVIRRVRPYGWHIALHVAGAGILRVEDLVRRAPVPVVIDHMARVDLRDGPDSGLDSEPVRALLRLLSTGHVWLKLSGADRLAVHPPRLDDAAALARMLAERAPRRVVWGTDFPHPNTAGFVPNDGDLVDLLATIAPDPVARHRILVANPTECFGFE